MKLFLQIWFGIIVFFSLLLLLIILCKSFVLWEPPDKHIIMTIDKFKFISGYDFRMGLILYTIAVGIVTVLFSDNNDDDYYM